MYYDNSWYTEIVDSAGDIAYETSIALDSLGNPHISYFGDTGFDLKYTYYDGSDWMFRSTVDPSGRVGTDNSIGLDNWDNPHISYFDSDGYNLKYARYITAGINENDIPTIPTEFFLSAATPNPCGSSASISFALPRTCEVDLSLYDIKGRKISIIARGKYQSGEYTAEVGSLTSGIYVYVLKADEFRDTKKMVVK